MGFSGFYRRGFERQALIPVPFGEIPDYAPKRKPGESEILKIPQIPQILILTKPRPSATLRAGRPRSQGRESRFCQKRAPAPYTFIPQNTVQ